MPYQFTACYRGRFVDERTNLTPLELRVGMGEREINSLGGGLSLGRWESRIVYISPGESLRRVARHNWEYDSIVE